MSAEDTVYLWLSSQNRDPSSISVSDFHVILTNRIASPVSADLVQVVLSYRTQVPPNLFISSRALGQCTISGDPNGSGLGRWWRSIPYMPQALANNDGNGNNAVYSNSFYNPRREHTPVLQDFLQDIDIRITDALGAPANTENLENVSILVAVKVRRE